MYPVTVLYSTYRDDVIKLLLPVFADPKSNMEVLGVTALAAGLISVGSCNLDVTSTILQTLIEKSETDLKVSPLLYNIVKMVINFLL